MNHAHSYLSKTELVKQLGYFPAFLIPAVNSSLIFRSLVQQTFSAYINNPLPNLFKEKLFVCLSRYFGASYFTICHSCTLLSLGMSASEILALQEITPPHTEQDITPDLKILSDRWGEGKGWQQDSQLEISLLRCSYYIFLYPSQAAKSIGTLQEILGNAYYNYLVIFLGYIKLCHQWVTSHPSISHQQDRRSQLHLGSLLLSESRLGDFFHSNIQLEDTRRKKLESAIAFRDLAANSNNSLPTQQATLANCLAHIPFPIMIHRHDDSILYLNRNWVEATGYNISDISTIAEWKQKAKVEQDRRELGLITSKTSQQIKREIERIPQMGTQTKNMLEDIADSLSNLAEEMAQIKIEYRPEKSVTSRASITTSDGENRFWELYTAPLCLEQEQEQLTISIVKDITEIVNSTRKIAEIEAKLNIVQETGNLGYWSWDLRDNTIEVCDLARNLLGLARFDGSYKSFLKSIHPEAREMVDLSLVKAIKTNRDLEIEYPIISSNYAIYWIRLKGKIRYNSAREVIGITGTAMDIIESRSKYQEVEYQYQPEQQTPVRQSFEELANIIDLLPSYIFVVNIRDEKISLVNQKLAKSLGLSDTTVIQDKTIAEYFSSDYARQAVWQQQQVMTYGKEIQVQEEVTLPDGIHYFDTTIAPLKNQQGEIYALLHTSNDIPDLADTKKALSQRTLQLEAANTELESFSYSVSHDLQAPLRVINGFSQVLWENYQPNLDDRGRHYLQRIQANSKKMSESIDALLQLSRVTRTQMKSVRVNLSQIAAETFEELRSTEPDRQVEFTLGENLTACGDPQLLRIVLNNLLHNAWKYTSKRERATIEFNLIKGESDRPTYYVRDNGAGFDLEYADKLFTAFKRLHTQEEFPGTGIGLATVKRIIYRHGGKVWADGEYDRGATIYFSL